MSNYPPPPHESQHYNTLYPASANASQLLDSVQQDQLQFSNLNQPIYPAKAENGTLPYSPSSRTLAHELQHATLDEQQGQHIHSDAQQIGQQPPNGLLGPHSDPQLVAQQSTPDQSQKPNRLRKACDSCSLRKVKCDESGPPCRACAALEIPCTFNRPSRRRGPPNRHAEAIKRRRLDQGGNADPISPHLSGTPNSTPSSPTHAAQALAALSSHSAVQPSAESICPLDTLEGLIDDFFIFVYPLSPFPHEGSFRSAWKSREDLSSPSFLALLAAMIGALAASYPRKVRLNFHDQNRDIRVPNTMDLIQRCKKVCSIARGPGYLEIDNLNINSAAISHYLGLISMYTSHWRQSRLFFGECLNILSALDDQRTKSESQLRTDLLPAAIGSSGKQDTSAASVASQSQYLQNDCIAIETSRRIFWTTFAISRATEQLGTDFLGLLSPFIHTKAYPPLPTEVDDFCIFTNETEPQPEGLVPLMTGFNANIRIYTSYDAATVMDLALTPENSTPWDQQKKVLHECLRSSKSAIVELPPDLVVDQSNISLNALLQTPETGDILSGPIQPLFSRHPTEALMDPASQQNIERKPEERRQIMYSIQKAHIYASMLATRHYLVGMYWRLRETYKNSKGQDSGGTVQSGDTASEGATAGGADDWDSIDREMSEERASIVRDLMIVLGSIDQVNVEAHADSFVSKIRSVTRLVLEQEDQVKDQILLQCQDNLAAFLGILDTLESNSSDANNTHYLEVSDIIQHAWAELREVRTKLTQQACQYELT